MSEIEKGDTVKITEDYNVFDTNVNGMTAVVLRPFSVDRIEKSKHKNEHIVKHLVYVKEIDEYCEPRAEWLELIKEDEKT